MAKLIMNLNSYKNLETNTNISLFVDTCEQFSPEGISKNRINNSNTLLLRKDKLYLT